MDDTENSLLGPGPSEQLAGEGLHMGRVVNLQAHLSLHRSAAEAVICFTDIVARVVPGDLVEHDCVSLDGLLAIGHLMLPPPPPHLWRWSPCLDLTGELSCLPLPHHQPLRSYADHRPNSDFNAVFDFCGLVG